MKRDARKFVTTNNDWNILAENNSSVTVERFIGQHMDMTLVINSQDFAVEMSVNGIPVREKTSFEGKILSVFVKKISHQTICREYQIITYNRLRNIQRKTVNITCTIFMYENGGVSYTSTIFSTNCLHLMESSGGLCKICKFVRRLIM